MPEMENTQSFYLNEVEVCPAKNQLIKDGQVVSIQPRVMSVLQYLANNHERVISTEELIEKHWDGRVVSYGTVPKCITSLRKSLNELLPNQDVVANYSKKGYQLLIAPKSDPLFQSSGSISNSEIRETNSQTKAIGKLPRFSYKTGIWISALTVFFLCIWVITYPQPTKFNHKTKFEKSAGFTNETGLERIAEPHPNGNHIAYVSDAYEEGSPRKLISTLLIRAKDGSEWAAAETDSSWFKISWSDDHSKLLAIEVKRSKGKPLTKDFFDIADYYYAVYLFEVDLLNQKSLSKKLITQWQGRLFSASWFNSTVVEIVARQGFKATNKRYRLDITQGSQFQEVPNSTKHGEPLASDTKNGMQAIAYRGKQEVLVSIFDNKNKLIVEKSFNAKYINMSWIPDGSGVLLHFDYKILKTLYINGMTKTINLTDYRDRLHYSPRYSIDGQSLYLTEKRFKSNLWRTPLQGERIQITHNETFNYLPNYSNQGDKILYASVRNNQAQIWLLEDKTERKILSTNANTISEILWNENDLSFTYKADDEIYVHNLKTNSTSKILSEGSTFHPIGWSEKSQQLLAIRSDHERSNIWVIDTKNTTKKQLTFGSTGSAVRNNNAIYFQYKNKPGLWTIQNGKEPRTVSETFPINSKMLHINSKGIFYILGGNCRESDIYFYNFENRISSTFQKRTIGFITTTSFHPQQGSLELPCYIPESNIIEYH